MAATVTSTEGVATAIGGTPRSRGSNGFHKNGGGRDGQNGEPFQFRPARYRVGVWVGIGSIVMLFTALTSAYIVRSASGNDWQPMAMPKVLWLSTLLIVISSVTMEVSRRSLKQQMDARYGRWLVITVALGLGFLVSADAATIYWHFMDGLWVALFVLLFFWK